MTVTLNLATPGNLTADAATNLANTWHEDIVAVFDKTNGCVLFTPNFSYNGKFSVCYSDNKGGFMDSIQIGNALKAKDIAFGVTIPNKVKELSEDKIPADYVIDPPLSQPAVTILTVKNPPSVTMLHVDRDVGTISYKSGTTPNLVYSADKGWTVKNNTTLIVIAVVIVVVLTCCLMNM
jgi:hypothetical protein